MFCAECGKELPAGGAKFCPNCGAPVPVANPAASEAAAGGISVSGDAVAKIQVDSHNIDQSTRIERQYRADRQIIGETVHYHEGADPGASFEERFTKAARAVEALDRGSVGAALGSLRDLRREDPGHAGAALYYGYALLRQGPVLRLSGAPLAEAEESLQCARSGESEKARATILLALLRHQVYRRNGGREPSPDFDTLKREARERAAVPSPQEMDWVGRLEGVAGFVEEWLF